MDVVSLVLFRRDLRLADQPALFAACDKRLPLIPIVLQDPNSPIRKRGAASNVFYNEALKSLSKEMGEELRSFQGCLSDLLALLSQHVRIGHVFWNKGATPQEYSQDKSWEQDCRAHQIEPSIMPFASLLWDPEQVTKSDGSEYRVFTPFYQKGCLQKAPPPRSLYPKAEIAGLLYPEIDRFVALERIKNVLPEVPDWGRKILKHWDVSEKGARALWKRFVIEASSAYKEQRNRMDQRGTTELSAYLACGIISPHQLWHAAHELPPSEHREHFCQELGWREFSASLLHYFPQLPSHNWNAQFDAFEWKDNKDLLEKWQKGQTGIPVVDAAMRQLWETGYMHNRARMIVGSFLVKNLLLPWQLGEQWFWDCLVDADLASNSASWQWVAGSGADAAPYFRVFNPVLQAEKFDPEAQYIKKYVPELQNLPRECAYAPWEHVNILFKYRFVLGRDYPQPCVCLKQSRLDALSAYELIKKQRQ